VNWYTINKENKLNIKQKRKYRDVLIMNEIGYGGLTAANFVRDLLQIDADTINLHVDSPGGSITDGVAIYNALRGWSQAQPGRSVDVYIDGVAASIASVIILAGDNVYIPENAGIYTHLPMLAYLEMPNRENLEEGIETLGRFENVLAGIYSKHTGADTETVTNWMANETWFFGQEAVEAGFATELIDSVAIAAQYNPENYEFLKAAKTAEQETPTQETRMEQSKVESEVKAEAATEEVAAEVVAENNDEAIAEASEEVAAEVTETEATEEVEVVEEAVTAADEEDEEVEEVEEADDEVVEALEAEQVNAQAIVELAKQYDQEGDLQQLVIEALVDRTPVAEFKDKVLEAIAQRPTTRKVEGHKVSKTAAELREELKNATPAEKFRISQKLKEIR
tara:strand:- start:6203 stop:7387 length:1185 start_codon:yes stop_codon:yes gene_type:complete